MPNDYAENGTKPGAGYSCLFLNTYYKDFVDYHYGRHPELKFQSYEIQKNALIATCFGDSDHYSHGLRDTGWYADDLIINIVPLQDAWRRQYGLPEDAVVVVEQVRSVQPDVVYIQDMHHVSREKLVEIRRHTRLVVGQIASPLTDKIPFDLYDLVISCVPHFVEDFRRAGITAYYQPLAFDPRILDQIGNPAFSTRTIRASFLGGITYSHTSSYIMLEMLAQTVKMQFWGYGVAALPDASYIRQCHHGEAWGTRMFKLLGTSRITVNRHIDIARNYACNMRMYEATGCGALLITDYKDNLNDLFEIGKEVVAYNSARECVDLVNYYLAHPAEAEKIAQAGQARTLRDHTYERRMRYLAEILERHLRYRQEQECYDQLNTAAISCGHTEIAAGDITTEMCNAWQDVALPARQRALVQKSLAAMYRGEDMGAYRVLAELLKPHVSDNSTLLELGCSSGYVFEILEYFLNKQLDFTGVDYSRAMIAMAKDYYPRANFFVADGANLFFADRQFQVVISSCVLLHVPNWREHVFETVRVADKFVVASRTPVRRENMTSYMKKYAYGVETVELAFYEDEFVREFLLNGLELVDAVQYDGDIASDLYQVTYLFKRQ